MMAWTLGVMAVLVVLIAVAIVIGGRLPREHVAVMRAQFRAPPDAVWAVIGDPVAAASWRKDVKRIERLPDVGGLQSWREHTSSGAITYVLAASVPGKSRTTRIVDDSLPFGGEWETVLEQSGHGTRLTITEQGFIKPPFFRLMARYVFGYTLSIRGYMVALGERLGEVVTPEPG